jgi:hypothetical protein
MDGFASFRLYLFDHGRDLRRGNRECRQETAALRDFNPAYDGSGSICALGRHCRQPFHGLETRQAAQGKLWKPKEQLGQVGVVPAMQILNKIYELERHDGRCDNVRFQANPMSPETFSDHAGLHDYAEPPHRASERRWLREDGFT